MNKIHLGAAVCVWLLVVFSAGARAEDPDAFQFTACLADVPIRSYPDTYAPRTGSVPKGTLVRVDYRNGEWVRVIYKVREGIIIGWSMAALLCPIER